MALPTTNLSVLAPATTAISALSNLVMVSPQKTTGYQPLNPSNNVSAQNPPSLIFNYEGENVIELSSDITDHYVENNTAIQDQWALRPERVTVHGFIGELNDIPANAALQALQTIAQKLTAVGAYAPGLSTTALEAYNEATLLYSVGASAVNSAISTASFLAGTGGENTISSNGIGASVDLNTATVSNSQSRQQVAFQQFYAYWHARWLFTVQTPWAVFQNMAIESLRAVQDEQTNMITDFYITFKLIRTASSLNVSSLPAVLQARLVNQAAPNSPDGTSTPAPTSATVSSNLTGMGVTSV